MQTATESSVVPEIGKYHLVAELARGGMGIVHLATAHGPGGFQKVLVVKELKPELCQDEAYVAMFLDEARLAARLQHRNIVQTIEVGSEGERHYMVMEFLDGRSLHRIAHRFAERGGFPVGAHLRIVAEALMGLHYAHDLRDFDGQPMGIVHRDVSPLNVLVTFDGQVKVIDFGIAKSIDSTLETKTGVLKGRIAYMAPEQAWGHGVDRRADVYSAGVMLWEAAAGRRLWPGRNEVEILATMLREGPPSPRSVRPEVAPELEAICARALARDPTERYQSAAELLEALEDHLAGRPDAMTMRDVGGLVSAVFADERRRTSALIEETISRVRGTHPRSGVMLALEGHTRGGTPSGSSRSCDDSSRGSGRLLPSPGAILGSLQASRGSVAPLGSPWRASWREWSRRRAAIVGAAAVALLLLIVVLVATLSGSDPPPSAEAAPRRIAAPPPPLEVTELPVAAESPVESDLDKRPAAAARWSAAHAPAHGSKRESPSASPSPAPTPAPTPAAPQQTELSPAGGRVPLRPIITSNPYGNQ